MAAMFTYNRITNEWTDVDPDLDLPRQGSVTFGVYNCPNGGPQHVRGVVDAPACPICTNPEGVKP